MDPNSVRKIADSVFALLDPLISSSDGKRIGAEAGPVTEREEKEREKGARRFPGIELWEIGPGTGALSHVLWQGLYRMADPEPDAQFRWLGIELDPVLCDILVEETFPAWSSAASLSASPGRRDESSEPIILGRPLPNLSLSLVRADARKWLQAAQSQNSDAEEATAGLRIICGNLPYYISTELLLASLTIPSAGCAFLVQKEYASRICDTTKGSSIAAFVRNWMNPVMGPRIGKNAFLPPPAVESCVLLLRKKEISCNGALLEKILRASFQGKRKTLRNSWKNATLGEGLSPELLEKAATECGLDASARAEDLKAEDFYRIVNWLDRR